MSRLDGTAGAYVTNNQIIRPVHFIYMDLVGDPVRANDSGMNVVVSGLTGGMADLNGTYDGVTGEFTSLSTIRQAEGGSDTVTARLSGLKTIDDATMDLFGDRTKWKGRVAKIFRAVWDQNGSQQGAFEHLHTCYMTDVIYGGDTTGQFIEVSMENYLAAFSQPSGRDYLNSTLYDPGDLSGLATIGAVNGAGGSHAAGGVAGGSFGPHGPLEPSFAFGQPQISY